MQDTTRVETRRKIRNVSSLSNVVDEEAMVIGRTRLALWSGHTRPEYKNGKNTRCGYENV